MAKPPKAFDVWLVAANTVYKQVPYTVVADWVQQGRLGAADTLRAAGTEEAWQAVAAWELFADYLPKPAAVASGDEAPVAPLELPDPADFGYRTRRRADDDDDIDMIPLIDISMVLLVFFIIISATGALSPIDVPDMRYAGELSQDPEAITISIEKASEQDVYYSVRAGKLAPKPEHAKLPTPEAALAALAALLDGRTRPPDVHVACAKELPSERVIELARELKWRKDKGLINSFDATVNEAPQQK